MMARHSYIILTKFSPGAFKTAAHFKQASAELTAKLKSECPGVHWKASYATLGQYDVVDIVEADDPADVHRAALLIHAGAHATTETLMATPWREYLEKI
ncbi:MAG: GYD domain-containing protein [Bacillota bacterium]